MGEVVKWVFVAWLVFGSILTVTQVGKPRKPLTGGVAAIVVVVCALEIVAILAYWERP
jgi:hypothetical protein